MSGRRHRRPSVRFQTKPELARQMLERLWMAHIPLAWVVADTVYGGKAVPAQLARSA
jgi:SRSO17 transposase